MNIDSSQDLIFDNPQKPIGASPATLIHVGEQKTEHFSVSITDYDKDNLFTEKVTTTKELTREAPYGKRWISAKGLHATEEIESLCKLFDVHPLIIEDILNTEGMPKIDEHEDYIFIRAKIPIAKANQSEVNTEQLSLLLLNDTVITFLEDTRSPLHPLDERLSKAGSRIRNHGTDYFTWAVLDIATDTLLAFANNMEDLLEEMEETISGKDTLPDLNTIHRTRREVAKLYRIVRPLRDIASHLERSDSFLFTERSKIFYRDLTDHIIQALEMAEYLREHASSIRELYFTTTSHKMNEVMKVLACISAIFLPLTFLAGIYGMNFEHMPGLDKPLAYPFLICVFIAIAGFMYRYFKKREWL